MEGSVRHSPIAHSHPPRPPPRPLRPTALMISIYSLPTVVSAVRPKANAKAAGAGWLGEHEGLAADDDHEDYGFDERLRVNEIGKLLTGQDNHFKDFLHPNPVPGSFLWGEVLLYEVKRTVAGAGRSAYQ